MRFEDFKDGEIFYCTYGEFEAIVHKRVYVQGNNPWDRYCPGIVGIKNQNDYEYNHTQVNTKVGGISVSEYNQASTYRKATAEEIALYWKLTHQERLESIGVSLLARLKNFLFG